MEERERTTHDPVAGPPSAAPAFAASTAPTTYRPSALEGGLHRFGALTLALARTDFMLHYEGSALGYLWSILRPLAIFAVLYTVLSQAAGFGDGVEHYPVYLLAAILLWTFFAETTGNGVTSLVSNGALLRKLRFPRLAIPMATTVKGLFNLGMNSIALAVFIAIAGVEPRWSWLELPLLVALLAALAVGVTLILSTLYVRYRDTGQVWQVVSQLLFYSSPSLYVTASYPDAVRDLLALTPLAAIFTQMRYALLDPSAPTAADAAGGTVMLVVPLGAIALSLALGLWLFMREAPKLAERL